MTSPTPIELLGAALFGLAVLHTFSTKWFERLAHRSPRHAGTWHLLGEVEVVFGAWAMVLMLAMLAISGPKEAATYLNGRNFTEPMFVFVIMVMAGSKPVLDMARLGVQGLARRLPLSPPLALFWVLLCVVPLMGSFITEPAAMTLAALMLRGLVFRPEVSSRLRYATLGVLFVNISIGGVLTPYAAPPVLMVAGVWGWDMAFMLQHFGWKAAIAVLLNGTLLALAFRRELKALAVTTMPGSESAPWSVMAVHALCMASVVVLAHHPAAFMGVFLFFLGYTHAYARHQSPLILKEALLVAFFLAGLVVLGGLQAWWLQPVLMGMSSDAVFFGATALTAITDNAALTYLGSLVPGLSDEFKVALVAGAVTGGGLTVIANAPNPAGLAVLREGFTDRAVHPAGLFLAALPATLVAVLAFRLL